MFNEKNKDFLPVQCSLPNSWYHKSAKRVNLPKFSPKGNQSFDVVIIGGGFTGIGAAITLAKNNINVALLEANEIGSGASGRNGGLVCSGFRHDQKWLENKLGDIAAHNLWEISQLAKSHLQSLINTYDIEADYASGLLFAAHNERMLNWLIEDKEHLENKYNYKQLNFLDNENCANSLSTNAYCGGVIDMGAGRIHPLKLLYGMYDAAVNLGANIYENSKALEYVEKNGNVEIKHENGIFKAKKLIICGDGYLNNFNKNIEAKVLPIYSFVIATEKLDYDILKNVNGAMDTKFVVNYFQKTADNRLIFGGGEKYSAIWPNDVASFVRKNMLKIYPQLEKTKVEYAWGGALGITSNRLPFVRALSNNVFCASGYSGQGVLLAPFFGDIMARQILNDKSSFEIIKKIPAMNFPGGRMLRFPLLSAAMTYYSILDKLP